jgi:hypothetical protein
MDPQSRARQGPAPASAPSANAGPDPPGGDRPVDLRAGCYRCRADLSRGHFAMELTYRLPAAGKDAPTSSAFFALCRPCAAAIVAWVGRDHGA